MRTVRLYHLVFIYFGFVLRGICALPSGELGVTDFQNVVTIPDIHGDANALQHSLWISLREIEFESQLSYDAFHDAFRTALLDLSLAVVPLSSAPKDTVLIQLGDIFDRGPNGLACLKIVENIERVIGWKTLRIYGNHELLNHMGVYFEYLHPAEPAKFEKHFKRPDARHTVFQSGGSVWKSITESTLLMVRIGEPSPSLIPSLSDLPSLDSPSTLFVHGGIETHWIDEVRSQHLESAPSLIDALNSLTQKVFTSQTGPSGNEFDFASYMGFSVRQSPLWIRDLTELNADYVCAKVVPAILRYFNVARLVVGHTPQLRMTSMCNSRVILADASMSRWMWQRDWQITDEQDPPQLDSRGVPILGQPCALIATQFDGELSALRAVYFDLNKKERSSDMFYPFSSLTSGDELFTVPPVNRPIFSSEPPAGSFGVVTVQSQAIGQRLGFEKQRIIERLRRSDLSKVFGIPKIIHQSNGLVVLDTFGPPLRGVNVITLPLVRQILEVFKDADSLALALESTPEHMMDLFIIEMGTNLVKLADFSALVIYDRWTPIETKLGQVCAVLSSVAAESRQSDMINYWRIVKEVFPNATKERFEASSGRLRAASSAAADLSDSGMWLRNEAIVDDGLSILGVSEIVRIAEVSRGTIFKATLKSGGKEQILLQLFPNGIANGQLPAGLIRAKEAKGPDHSLYLLFEHGGDLLSTVYQSASVRDQREVVSHAILSYIEQLHKGHVVLGFSDLMSDEHLLNFFVYEEKEVQKVFLVDISRLGRENDLNTCQEEMKRSIAAVERLLAVEIFDPTEEQTVESSSPATTVEDSDQGFMLL